MNETMKKFESLKTAIAERDRVIVAFSGGTDSAFLLAVCVEVLGSDRVLAVTASSATYTPAELHGARELAASLHVGHRVIETDELADEAFAANPPERCYHCKRHFFKDLRALADAEGIAHCIDGSNADDVSDYRPGHTAALEAGIESPLMDAGLTKTEIRELSRERGLPTWNKPANPCLASRVPYGTRITGDMLAVISAAEDFIRGRGFAVVRVRHHGDIARIEVPVDDLPRFCGDDHRDAVTARLRELGFTWVALDLAGYRMGSLNAAHLKDS